MDTSAPPQKFETLRHQTHGAEMSWVRSVLCPKCPYTINCLSPLQNFWIRYWSAPPYLSQMHIMNYTRFNTGKSELLQTIIRPIGRGAPTAPSPPLWIRLLLHHLPEADDAEQAKDNAKLYEYLSASFLQLSSFSIAKTRDSAVFSDVVTQITGLFSTAFCASLLVSWVCDVHEMIGGWAGIRGGPCHCRLSIIVQCHVCGQADHLALSMDPCSYWSTRSNGLN